MHGFQKPDIGVQVKLPNSGSFQVVVGMYGTSVESSLGRPRFAAPGLFWTQHCSSWMLY